MLRSRLFPRKGANGKPLLLHWGNRRELAFKCQFCSRSFIYFSPVILKLLDYYHHKRSVDDQTNSSVLRSLALQHAPALRAHFKAATLWEAVAWLDRIKIPTIPPLESKHCQVFGYYSHVGSLSFVERAESMGGSPWRRRGSAFYGPAPPIFASGAVGEATSTSGSALKPGSVWWESRWRRPQQPVFERDKQVPTYSLLFPAVLCLPWGHIPPLVALTWSRCVQFGDGPPIV